MVRIALLIYAGTMLVGLVAQLRWLRFGRVHHALYACCCASALAVAWFHFQPALLMTLGALAAMPLSRPRTAWHPALAVLGLLGYVAAYSPWSTQ